MNNSGEEVGKISYSVEIDVSALKSGAKSAEEAIKTSFNSAAESVKKPGKEVDALSKKLNDLEKNLKPIVAASALASGAVTAGFTMAAKSAFEQVRAVENASFGLRAYEKDAGAVNTVLGQLITFARSDQGVLFNREELFQAASNLKGFGEATSMLNQRVQTLAKGVAVGNTTFDELSQIMGRSASQGKLTTEAYDQLAYRGIILDSSLRGAAVSADELYTALDNAIDDSILEGRANTIDGLLIRLQSAWRDLGGTILGVDSQTSQFIKGGLGDALIQGIIGITNFIKENKQLIVTVGTSVIVFGILTGAMFLAVKATLAIRAALIALGVSGAVAQARMLGLIGIISAIAGVVAGNMLQGALESTSDGLGSMNTALDDTTNFTGAAEDGVGKLTQKLQDLDEQARKVESDYIENLARIVQGHQKSIKELTKQIENENDNYNAAVKKRLTAFQEEQGKELTEHSKKVKNLQNQIDFLRKYQHSSNKQQLSELQFSLAQENAQYTERNAERQAKYDADAEAERLSYEKRLEENQAKLDAELAVLEKHRESVNAVRGVILLDEIERLKQSRAEQLKSLDKQRQDAISSNQSTGTAAGDAFRGNVNKEIDKLINDMRGKGNTAGTGFIENLSNIIKQHAPALYSIGDWIGARIWDGMKWYNDYLKGKSNFTANAQQGLENVQKYGPLALFGGGSLWKFADGGFTGRGGKYEEAGIVHRGEYVLPKHMVNQSTGLPSPEAMDQFSGGNSTSSSNTYQITIPISGAIVTSPQDQRKFAEVIGKKINEVMQQKGFKPALEGM